MAIGGLEGVALSVAAEYCACVQYSLAWSNVMARKPSPFLERVRDAIRVRHYSLRTEQAYLMWVRRFILFHGKRHPAEMGAVEVGAFLTHLAVARDVAPATQNQALNALAFLYGKVLEQPLGNVAGVVRAARPPRLPVVLS